MSENESPDYCPRCGKKTFYYSFCEEKVRCRSCNYFLVTKDFLELKNKAKKKDE